ncbi:MAG: DNA repair protein RecO [Chitinophagales bacterium]|jgi:DNA repair protein RecO (recombination protein O)|nr:DNA repair protein RecO [Chitinophagales bacterium]
MYCKDIGLVIQNTKFSDTSLIIKVFTRTYGLLSFMVKSARSQKSKNASVLLKPMNILSISFIYRESRNLQTISEFNGDWSIYHIADFEMIMQLVWINELLQQIFKEAYYQDSQLFDFIESELKMSQSKKDKYFYISFTLRLLQHFGLLSPSAAQVTSELMLTPRYLSILESLLEPNSEIYQIEPEDKKTIVEALKKVLAQQLNISPKMWSESIFNQIILT